MKKKKGIFIDQWLKLKPYKKHSPVDLYYLKLVNRVYEEIKRNPLIPLDFYMEEAEKQLLSCFLISYFEDIISSTNVWNTFIQKHEEMYAKKLPFYATEEYYEQGINEQDVRFLIWYFINTIHPENFLDPHAEIIAETASRIMEIFEEEFENAPENEALFPFYQLKGESDFYEARKLIDTLLFSTYLFYPDTGLKLKDSEGELIEENRHNVNLLNLLNHNRDTNIHTSYTKLLSLKGKDWAAALLGSTHPLHDHIDGMSKKVQGSFLYKGQNNIHIKLEHIATSKIFKLLKESVSSFMEIKKIDTLIFMGVVKWKGDWWFSGITFTRDYDPAIVLEEKNSFESKRSVAFLDEVNPKTYEMLEKQKERFLEFNNGSFIAFLPSVQLNKFFRDFTAYYNQSLKVPKEEYEKALKRIKKIGGEEPIEPGETDFSEVAEDGLVFFNPASGGEVALGISSAFPSKNNPYYKEENSTEDVMFLLTSKDFSKELVLYCIDHYKDDLPFFRDGPGKKYLEELDFLLRFWKEENYHTTPAITFV